MELAAGRRGWRGGRAAAVVASAALLALWLTRGGGAGGSWGSGGGALVALDSRRVFAQRAPADIAHRLADFSLLPHALTATPGSWRVEEERGNWSTWRYSVEWACGAGCRGRARVSAVAGAGAGGAPQHGGAREHRVSLRVRTCTAASWPWRDICDEMEIAAEVGSDGARGALLAESARARCGAAPAAACAAGLRAHRRRHHAILEGPLSVNAMNR